MILINHSVCDRCATCCAMCPHDALLLETQRLLVRQDRCTQCLRCVRVCPLGALSNDSQKSNTGLSAPVSASDGGAAERFDVIVVGGGPAGLIAAITVSRAGKKVCLVDRKEKIGEPVRCGEGVGFKGFTKSLDIRPEWILRKITRAGFVAPDGTTVAFDLTETDQSCVIDRVRFEQDLLKDALAAKTFYKSATTVTAVVREADGMYRCDSTAGQLSAPCVVIAEGVESAIAKQLGFRTGIKPVDIETCAFAHITHESIDQNTCLFYTGNAVTAGGYAWVFPRGNNQANVGLGVLGSHHISGKAQLLLQKFVADRFPGATLQDLHCGGVPVGKGLATLVKGGVVIVGDAAGQVNSLTGAGITYGMLAAQMAGNAILSAFTNSTFDQRKLRRYQKEWFRIYGKQQVRSYVLKNALIGEDDRFLDNIAHALAAEDPKKLNFLRVFMKTFSRRPLLLLKAMRLFG